MIIFWAPTTLGKLPKRANFLIDNATRRNIAAEHSNLALKMHCLATASTLPQSGTQARRKAIGNSVLKL